MYRVETDSLAAEQIAALPDEALSDYAQMLGVLELVPWNSARGCGRGAGPPEGGRVAASAANSAEYSRIGAA